MQLDLMTWPEVEAAIKRGAIAVLPTGSTEQHGPMGLIGTDRICAEAVALQAATVAHAIVAPPLAYTPAPFNTAFPGTLSLSEPLYQATAAEIISGLLAQGFAGVYVLNGHGANLAPLRAAVKDDPKVLIRSWWDYPQTNALRQALYGDWEGMHATPSEVAMTQALHGIKPAGKAAAPPKPLPPGYAAAHAGDKHGPPDEHRAQFPDGRVGAHSALATPEDGARLLELASKEAAEEIAAFRAGLTN